VLILRAVSSVAWFKRLMVGRPVRSDWLAETLLSKRLALPIFASDPLSSVAYATQEILLILTLGGVAFLNLTPWIGLAVVVLLTAVVLSYRQAVQAYPSGGGSYETASQNLGRIAGLVVAGALMVDYIMTVAVSVAAGVDNMISAVPELNPHRVAINIGFLLLLTAINLRGVRESGRTFAVPRYAFIVGVMAMIAVGVCSMPWQLRSGLGRNFQHSWHSPGDTRRGINSTQRTHLNGVGCRVP
jgi:amino acid transporter